MIPIIAHIYGPFAIHGYGLAVAIGLLIFYAQVSKDPARERIISIEHLSTLLIIGIIAGIIGGRILYIISNPEPMTYGEMIRLWEGGLSFLGALIAVLAVTPWYLKKIGTPFLPLLDLVSLYIPLLYACSRIGCFLAGCCYGLPTTQFWGITYTSPESHAPLCIALHPTQLYSAVNAMGIFLLLHIIRPVMRKPGQIVSSYLIAAGVERFAIDFLRADRFLAPEYLPWMHAFSIDQLIALGIAGVGLVLLGMTSMQKAGTIEQKQEKVHESL